MRVSAWRANAGQPYPASVVGAGLDWAVCLTGCGDGSVQLLPADRLEPLAGAAVRARGTAGERLSAALSRLDWGTHALGNDPSLMAASADGVVAVWDHDAVHLGHCGLSVPWLLSGGTLVPALEPESVAARTRRQGMADRPGWGRIAVRRFGTGSRDPYEVIAVSWSEIDAVLLTTHEVWGGMLRSEPAAVELRGSWLRSALVASEPAEAFAALARGYVRLDGQAGAVDRFDARAAVVVLQSGS